MVDRAAAKQRKTAARLYPLSEILDLLNPQLVVDRRLLLVLRPQSLQS
jgi:hypothetical protein